MALDGALEPVVREYWASEAGALPGRVWSTEVPRDAYRGYQSPALVAFPIYEHRLGGSLDDVIGTWRSGARPSTCTQHWSASWNSWGGCDRTQLRAQVDRRQIVTHLARAVAESFGVTLTQLTPVVVAPALE